MGLHDFKVGDKVRCIDVHGTTLNLERTYTVNAVGCDASTVKHLKLSERGAWWSFARFVPAAPDEIEPPKMKFSALPLRRTHTLPQDSNERKEFPLYSGLVRYCPAALAAVANLSKLGNDKHNPGQPLHHSRFKSNDHDDCIIRHTLDQEEDFGKGKGRDENGVPQVVMRAWRALMAAQIWLEENDGAPIAPGAKLKPDQE